MRLEDEIDLPLSDDPHEKAMLNLAYTYSVVLERTLRVLKPFQLNDQHYNILKTLQEQSPRPTPVGTLKRLLINKRGDLTRLLDKLSASGLVHREVNPENRREVLVTLSARGVEVLSDIDRQMAAQRHPQDNLTLPEAERLNELLDLLRQ